MEDHPVIKLFEARAELLDIVDSAEAMDDAISALAGWMAQAPLGEDDLAVLGHIGAVLYREGLRRRIGIRPGGISDEQRNLYRLVLEAVGLRSPTADAALNQLNAAAAHSDDAAFRRLVETVADAYRSAAHDPSIPIRDAEHCHAYAAALVQYCRHRLNHTF